MARKVRGRGVPPYFFVKSVILKGFRLQLCKSVIAKGFRQVTLQEYDSKAISFGSQTMELRDSWKDSPNPRMGAVRATLPNLWKLGLGIVVPGAPGAAFANCEHVLFYRASKAALVGNRPAEEGSLSRTARSGRASWPDARFTARVNGD